MNITLDEQTVKQLVEKVTEQVLKQMPINNEQKPNANDTEVKRYMNQKEVCKYLNVSAHTVNEYIKRGLKVIQINDCGRSYYDRKDADEFMESHKIGTKC